VSRPWSQLYREHLGPPSAAQRAALARSKAMPRPHWLVEPEIAWKAEADYVPTKLLPLRHWDAPRTPPYEVVWAWVVQPRGADRLPRPADDTPVLALPAPAPAQLELFP
jgi:hypothetical protein